MVVFVFVRKSWGFCWLSVTVRQFLPEDLEQCLLCFHSHLGRCKPQNTLPFSGSLWNGLLWPCQEERLFLLGSTERSGGTVCSEPDRGRTRCTASSCGEADKRRAANLVTWGGKARSLLSFHRRQVKGSKTERPGQGQAADPWRGSTSRVLLSQGLVQSLLQGTLCSPGLCLLESSPSWVRKVYAPL